MRHLFIHQSPKPVATWLEAMADATALAWAEFAGPAAAAGDVLWCRLGEGGDIESAVAAIRRHSDRPLVIMSDTPDEAGAARAIAAGASGYCNTHAAPAVLQRIAVVVENGGLWVGPSLMQRLLGATAKGLGERAPAARERWSDKLSEREREVALKVAAGASNKEIADGLAITERTVKAHLGAIFEKLGVRDRLQLSLRVNGQKI